MNWKKPKSSCLKWRYCRSDIDHRVASLFTRYLINCQRNKFEIDRSILKCINQRKDITVTDGRTDPNCRNLRFKKFLYSQLERAELHVRIWSYYIIVSLNRFVISSSLLVCWNTYNNQAFTMQRYVDSYC